MKYYIYLRVSTGKQDDSGLGIEAQTKFCMEWINKQSVQSEIVIFKDVVTGTDKKRKELEERPALLEMLSMLQKDDIVVIYKRERISRDPYIIGMIERTIERKKARFVSSIGEMDGDQPQDVLMRRIVDAFAEYETLLISARTKNALAAKKARGERIGRVPYGYSLQADKTLAVALEEAEVLQFIHQLKNAGATTRYIAIQLNENGYRNRGVNGKSSSWTHGAINRVYANYERVWSDLAYA
jgi:DNA invertase Pin-like site-specific DNA recombinase